MIERDRGSSPRSPSIVAGRRSSWGTGDGIVVAAELAVEVVVVDEVGAGGRRWTRGPAARGAGGDRALARRGRVAPTRPAAGAGGDPGRSGRRRCRPTGSRRHRRPAGAAGAAAARWSVPWGPQMAL